MVQQPFDSNAQTHVVVLDKTGKRSFGICIVRGEVKDSPNSKTSGIFIKGIVPQSPAHICGKLKVGDRILTLNQQDVRNATEQNVIDLIKDAGMKINLEVQTFGHKQNEVSEVQLKPVKQKSIENGTVERKDTIKKDNKQPSNKPLMPKDLIKTSTTTSSAVVDDGDDEEDTRDMTGRTFSEAGYEIDRASAGNCKLNKIEQEKDKETPDEFGYTMAKIKKRYSNLKDLRKIEVTRPPNTDLGLALAGHRDRQKMACFVAGLHPQGLMAKCDLKPGDEILEVNGTVLQNRCHLNASVIFKNILNEKLVFVSHRRKANDEGISVKPFTRFPPIVDETEYLFTAYKNVKSVKIQKVGCLGLMIIEGKHIEVGRGIFISDLKEGSNAVEAGLKVGDLVLAVNKDVLVESTYDEAAAILKRVEGIVTMVICSLKTEEQIMKERAEEEKKKQAAEKKEPEKPVDPSVAEITTNKKVLIEINVQKKPLGVIVTGGKNNYVKTGCNITHIYPEGVVAQDKRLQLFDHIIAFNGTPVNCAEMTTLKVHQLFHLAYEKATLLVWRNDPPEIETITVEFAKKPGKDLGLSLAPNEKGATIVEITSAGYADIDNKLQRGDIISKFNGDSLENASFAECYALFKGANGKISLEVLRPKPTTREK
ncbi:inactivation-no-after-potential D protein [Eupeodes corollae]|uniref:inactivation-no-after-potential D protein n=1 Tax=Eupeodes corollae TaxID=290404 RepID=UPI0024901168|nr:inactivation-no-after-potential D protein [Eupeodes corollae]